MTGSSCGGGELSRVHAPFSRRCPPSLPRHTFATHGGADVSDSGRKCPTFHRTTAC